MHWENYVITSNFSSLNFVEELEVGKQAGNITEIVEAVKYIIDNEIDLQSNCLKKYQHICFENYWTTIESTIMKL